MATIHQLIDALTDLTVPDPTARTASAHSDLPLLLDTAEAAKLLSLSRSKVCDMASRGEIPWLRIGRAVRIPRDELVVWIGRNANAVDFPAEPRLPDWAHVDRREEL